MEAESRNQKTTRGVGNTVLQPKILESKILKSMQKPPKLGENDGKGDPDEYVQLVNEILNYYSTDDAYKCKFLVLTLIGSNILWFDGLPDGCIG